MRKDTEFLRPFKYSKPLAGSRTAGKIPVHMPKLPDNRSAGKIPVHTPKPVPFDRLRASREIDIDSKLSNFKPYKKEGK